MMSPSSKEFVQPSSNQEEKDNNNHATSSPSPSTPIPEEDLRQIWKWNASIPSQIQGTIHNQITSYAEQQPDSLAVCAWDGNFTYAEVDAIATRVARKLLLAIHQQHDKITPSKTIPLLFSKSKWTPVAMLAVLKAGCSAVALDATQPDSRLESIVEQVKPGVIVASEKYRQRAASMMAGASVVQLDETVLEENCDAEEEELPELPTVEPSDIAYISFTSYVRLQIL